MRRIRRKPARKHRSPSGFTLMEVLLVLAILGVIVGLVLPNLLGSQQKANIQATKLQIHGISEAASFYALDHAGSFPPSIEELIQPSGSDANWKGPYLKVQSQTVPVDPWGRAFQYASPGTNSVDGSPDIWSSGPDGQPNTGDDVTSWTK